MITINATEVQRKDVKVEISTNELFNVAGRELSNKAILSILRERIADKIKSHFDLIKNEKRNMSTNPENYERWIIKVCVESENYYAIGGHFYGGEEKLELPEDLKTLVNNYKALKALINE